MSGLLENVWADVERPEPASLSEILDAIVDFVRSYVVLDAEQADAITLWAAHTHCIDAFEFSPYVAASSAEMRSGKTTLMKLLELIVARPWRVVTPSEAVVYRKIDRDRPTILLDEYDTIFRDREQEPLRALLNAGNEAGATVPRCAGANRDALVDFKTFCPKALAGIGRLPTTIADRCIEIRLKRKAPGEAVSRFRRRDIAAQAEPLLQLLVSWGERDVDALALARPDLPAELNDRAADGWEPLLAIADRAGGDWPERARRSALALSSRDGDEESMGVRLLADVRTIFAEREVEKLASGTLTEALAAIEEAPWGDWKGKPLHPRGLARILRSYGIKSEQLWTDGKNIHGYRRERFEDAWTRYLTFHPLEPLEPASDQGLSPLSQTLDVGIPSVQKNGSNPHGNSALAYLADGNPKTGRESVFTAPPDGPLPGLA
jgi:hypothetical protein